MRMSKSSTAVAITFIWIGFVGAISFMEAWLKFQAPGVSLNDGLAIGKLVFKALNKVEWVCCLLILVSQLRYSVRSISGKDGLFLLPVIILLVQSIYVLPALGHRIDLYLQHQNVPASNLHLVYVALEVVKVAALTLYGFAQLRHIPSFQTQQS